MQPDSICAITALIGPGDHDCSFRIQADTFTQPGVLYIQLPKAFSWCRFGDLCAKFAGTGTPEE